MLALRRMLIKIYFYLKIAQMFLLLSGTMIKFREELAISQRRCRLDEILMTYVAAETRTLYLNTNIQIAHKTLIGRPSEFGDRNFQVWKDFLWATNSEDLTFISHNCCENSYSSFDFDLSQLWKLCANEVYVAAVNLENDGP